LQRNLATYRNVTSDLFGVSRANTPELAYEWSSQRLDPAADTLSTDLENLYDASVAEQTSASTEEVSASTQQTSAAVQQIAAAAQELSGRAEELEALVGRFTLSRSLP
jgi:hypothetical protein